VEYANKDLVSLRKSGFAAKNYKSMINCINPRYSIYSTFRPIFAMARWI